MLGRKTRDFDDPRHPHSQARRPEVLVWEEIEVGKPGPGEARVRHTAVGVNFVDIYIRTGLHPVTLPSGLGTEAAGTVEEIVVPGLSTLATRHLVLPPPRPLASHAGSALIRGFESYV